MHTCVIMPGADVGGIGNGFELSCSMPGATIKRVLFASFGNPSGAAKSQKNGQMHTKHALIREKGFLKKDKPEGWQFRILFVLICNPSHMSHFQPEFHH